MSKPTNTKLYNRVKAAAKRKFDVYPSAYANSWLSREYKKRGGGYSGKKSSDLSKAAAKLRLKKSSNKTCPECKGKGCSHCSGKGYHK